MRTIKGQNLVRNENESKFPNGQIVNEDGIQKGTPVVNEVYGDLLENFYKLLRLVGVNPTETEDSEQSQHQLIDALKLFSNELNDIQKILSFSGGKWLVDFNFDLLPENYVFIAKASDNYQSGLFSGLGDNEFNLTSINGFNANDNLLVIISSDGVKAESLNGVNLNKNNENEILCSFGNPLSFNDSDEIYFMCSGVLISNLPQSYPILNFIKSLKNDLTISYLDSFILKGFLVVFCVNGVGEYSFYNFSVLDFSSPTEISLNGFDLINSENNNPYVYCDGTHIYISNQNNKSADDFSLSKAFFSENNLTFVSNSSVQNSFKKSTNYFIKNDDIFLFIQGNLSKYDLSTGVSTSIFDLPGVNGYVFNFNGFIYYLTGDSAIKWNI